MGFIKRVRLGITRRPFRSLSLLLIIIVISLFAMVGYFLQLIVSDFEKSIEDQVGLSILLIGVDKKIDEETIEELSRLPHVIGCNITERVLAIPQNFANAIDPATDSDIFANTEAQPEVYLISNRNAALYDSFRRGDMVLTAGQYPDQEKNSVLIDAYLAQQNGLQIGDQIILGQQIDHENKITLTITGLYQTLVAPEEVWDTKYGRSPYSYLFCNREVFSGWQPEAMNHNGVDIFVDERANMDGVLSAIQSMPLDWTHYQVWNNTENTIEISSQIIGILRSVSSLVLTFSAFSAFGILLLMTILWMRDHLEETGIYVSLGMSKPQIVFHYVTEIFLISVAALTISLVVGHLFINHYREQIIDFSLNYSSIPVFVHSDAEERIFKENISIGSLLASNVYFLILSCATTLCSSVVILRYNPRRLFGMK